MVPVPGIIRDTRGVRIIRKNVKCLFSHRPANKILHSYKVFKNELTNRRGKKGPFLNLKRCCIINGLIINIVSGTAVENKYFEVPGTRYTWYTRCDHGLHCCRSDEFM